MHSRLRLYSNIDGEIYRFLSEYFLDNDENSKSNGNVFNSMYKHVLEWENIYSNPVEIASIIGVLMDNIDNYQITIWLSLDKDFFIKITKDNVDDVIKYLYERYPY